MDLVPGFQPSKMGRKTHLRPSPGRGNDRTSDPEKPSASCSREAVNPFVSATERLCSRTAALRLWAVLAKANEPLLGERLFMCGGRKWPKALSSKMRYFEAGGVKTTNTPRLFFAWEASSWPVSTGRSLP